MFFLFLKRDTNFFVLLSNGHDITKSKFHAFQQSCLGSITVDFPFKNGNVVLVTLKFGSVAKGGDTCKSFKSWTRSIVLNT